MLALPCCCDEGRWLLWACPSAMGRLHCARPSVCPVCRESWYRQPRESRRIQRVPWPHSSVSPSAPSCRRPASASRSAESRRARDLFPSGPRPTNLARCVLTSRNPRALSPVTATHTQPRRRHVAAQVLLLRPPAAQQPAAPPLDGARAALLAAATASARLHAARRARHRRGHWHELPGACTETLYSSLRTHPNTARKWAVALALLPAVVGSKHSPTRFAPAAYRCTRGVTTAESR